MLDQKKVNSLSASSVGAVGRFCVLGVELNMPRLNIEDDWWTDPRRDALLKHFGGDDIQADGLALKAWRLAQGWHKKRLLVPAHVWDAGPFKPLEDVKLVTRRAEGVYVHGSTEKFKWLTDCTDAGKRGGEASGKARRTLSKPIEANGSKCKRIEPSYSSSSSSSSSQEKKYISPSDFDSDLASRWAEFAKSRKPHLQPNIGDYAKSIRLLRTSDGLTEPQLTKMLAFVRDDEFWQDIALSPVALRGKSKTNGFHKWENVLSAMLKAQPKRSTTPILEPLDRPRSY